MSESAQTRVVGILVDTLTEQQIVERVMGWTTSPTPKVAVGINAAVCNLAATNPDFRRNIHNADLSYADGQSIVWATRLLGRPAPERVATTDLIHPIAAASAERGKLLYFYGGSPGVAERAAVRLRESNPGLTVVTRSGFTAPEDMPEVIAEINASGAHILCIGLGDPLQQHWVATHRAALTVPVILTCGGLFDWVSGDNPRAPSWMIAVGCEWLWRLLIEPRRLARRYLLGNPAFLYRLGVQLARGERGGATTS